MSNPFTQSLDWFRGKQVIVRSNDGELFKGWIERIHHEMRHVALKGAEYRPHPNIDEWEYVGAAFVAHADYWRLADPGFLCRPIKIDTITLSPYHQRTFDPADNAEYIAEVHEYGWAGSFPTVRQTEGGYECVSGNKRLWVAEQAGLHYHPCLIRELTDMEAATAFAFDHFPLPDVDGDRYDDELVLAAVEAMRYDLYGDVYEIWPVRWNLKRLGIAADQAWLDEFEEE